MCIPLPSQPSELNLEELVFEVCTFIMHTTGSQSSDVKMTTCITLDIIEYLVVDVWKNTKEKKLIHQTHMHPFQACEKPFQLCGS